MTPQELAQASELAKDDPQPPQRNPYATGTGNAIAPNIPGGSSGSGPTPAPPISGASGSFGFSRIAADDGIVVAISGPVPTSVTAAYTVNPGDDTVEVNATSSAITITLLLASSAPQKLVTIIKTDSSANAVTIDTSGSDTLNGLTSVTLSNQYDSVILYSDGTTWYIWGSSPAVGVLSGPAGVTWTPSDGGMTVTGAWNAQTSGYVLGNMTGSSAAPTFGLITTLGTVATGVWNGTAITYGFGGTGLTAAPTNGQLLIGNGTGYTLATLTAGSNITITNTAGSITIAASGGGSSLPTDYISGMIPSFVSTTEIQVGTGTAYNPNASASQTVSSPITDTYLFTSKTDLTIDASNNKKVTSASHSFTANDIGSTISVTAGTSWTTGTYIILTVSGGAALLNKSPSAAGNANTGTYLLELTASVLYGIFLAGTTSIVIQGPMQFVDLAIDASNNLLVSSASFTFTSAMVGQYIDVTAGTSWTVGYYQIASVSGGKATLATSPSAAGNANLATASMSMISYTGSTGNYQGTASESIDGNTYRYLGAVLTTSANLFANFLNVNGVTRYRVNITAAPFSVTLTTATSSTSQSLSALIPPTGLIAVVQGHYGGVLTFFGTSDGVTPTGSTGDNELGTGVSASAAFPMELNLNTIQALLFCNSGAASAPVLNVQGYRGNR